MRGGAGTVALVGGLLSAASAQAFELSSAGPPEPTASIEFRSAMSTLPSTGCFPVRIALANRDVRAHRYEVRTTGGPSNVDGNRMVHVATLEVPPGQARAFDVLAPLPAATGRAMSWSSLTVEVEGGPLGTRRTYLSTRIPGIGERRRPSIGFGSAIDAPQKALSGAVPGDVHAVSIDVDLLPADPRALIGLDALWLTAEEMRRIPEASRRGVQQWLASGGDLVLLAPPSSSPPLELGPSEADWADGRFGLGRLVRIDVLESGDEGLQTAAGSLAARVVASEHDVRTQMSETPGAVRDAFPPIEVARARIGIFLGVLALLIGPLNLFVLAPKKHRTRLLWTTPALSVGASVILVGLILTEDGVGGAGRRAQLVLQMPQLSFERRVQVQASRTGLVPFTGFELADDVLMEPVDEHEDGDRRLETSEGRAGGEWFRTRSVQSQLLTRYASTRARVELTSKAGAPPRLTSSLPVALESVYFSDDAGQYWTTARLAPGQSVDLDPAGVEAAQAALAERLAPFPGHVAQPVQSALPRGGWLFARAEGIEPIETLAAVEFEDEPVLWVGQVVRGGQR